MVVVLLSVTALMVAVGLVVEGRWWALLLIPTAAAGILLALRLTPEGGTTGYFDRNI